MMHTTLHIKSTCILIGILLMSYCAKAQYILQEDAIANTKITNETAINTARLESSPCFYGDKIGFVYSGEKGKFFDKDINEPFFTIGFTDVAPDFSLSNRTDFDDKINADYHRGPMAFDHLTNTLYFTKTHKESRRIRGILKDTAYLRIMSAVFSDGKTKVSPLNINIDRYSVCHPTLSEDGKRMIFSSNKPDGIGGMDLYTAYFDGSEWGGIINVGASINSQSNEVFPFLLSDTILVYSSDRVEGLGGLDMFVSVLRDGVWTAAQAIPKPFNSAFDDLGMIVRPDGKTGYFASNRPGGMGKDDIYSFKAPASIFGLEVEEMVDIFITVLDKLTLEPISGVGITLTPLAIDANNFTLSSYNVDMMSGVDPGDLVLKLSPKKGKSLPTITSDNQGRINILLKKSQKYLINAIHEGFDESSLVFAYDAYGSNINMVLEPSTEDVNIDTNIQLTSQDVEQIYIPTEVGSSVVFDNIFYSFNSAIIQTGAARELDALAAVMIQNPTMKVKLEAHTDSRGKDAFNLSLSQDRAASAAKYLHNLGIDLDRIITIGYGESKLRNHCIDGVSCSDEEHQFNRRTEVIIVEK